MSRKMLLIVKGSSVFIFIAVISLFIAPTSFILREYPDESDFDLLFRFFWASSIEHQCKVVHVGTSDASFIPKALLPRLVYARKKACQSPVRISIGKPSIRIETFSDGATPTGIIMQWSVIDGKVVDFSVENNGVRTSFDVIEFSKTTRQWISFLKATVDSTASEGDGN